MASQHQSQSQPPVRWSELPPEILGLILSNLGKHDLLNARLISRAWNEESLKVLRKSKFTQMLREQTIKDYLLFTTLSVPRQFIIPFHLNFEVDLGISGLHDLTLNVQSLCQVFGPKCVSTFTLTSEDTSFTQENIKDTGLIEFLTLVSTGLKTLDLSRLYFRLDFLQNQVIIFPNLKKFVCNTLDCQSGRAGPNLVCISVIENSPNLQDLILTAFCDTESWPLNFNQLRCLTIYTMINPQNILDKILACSGPPVLQELNFGNDVTRNDEDRIIVYNILKSVSSTLRSLTVQNLFFPGSTGVPRRIMRFPRLPHLEHLGLESYVGCRSWQDIEDMNFSEETFPSLKSIELPTEFFPTSSPGPTQENNDVRIEFPNLIRLILREGGTYADGFKHLNGAIEHLQKIFPTPSKISLVCAGGDDCVKYLLALIMKSDWSENFQEIQMNEFSQDYLGQFLDELKLNPRVVLETCDGILENLMRIEFQNMMKRLKMEWTETLVSPGSIVLEMANQLDLDSIKMINITTIKLDLIGESPFNLRTSHLSTRASIPNLTAMAKHFPQLRNIEVSGLLCRDKSVWSNHILEFKSNFPCVNLYLT